jgi:hypothetical protein
VKGKHVSGFTNGEEEEMKLTHVVPFLVEDELMRLGATFEKVRDWQPFSIVDLEIRLLVPQVRALFWAITLGPAESSAKSFLLRETCQGPESPKISRKLLIPRPK